MRYSRKRLLWEFVIGCGIGLFLGNLLGLLGYLQVISRNGLKMIIKAALGVVVLIVDSLCIWSLIHYHVNKRIEAEGGLVTGLIRTVLAVPKSGRLSSDDWKLPVQYHCRIAYVVGGKVYEKDFPPTIFVTKQALYPFRFQRDGKIPLKYDKKHPGFAMISIGVLKRGYFKEFRRNLIHITMIPLLLTGYYVVFLLSPF